MKYRYDELYIWGLEKFSNLLFWWRKDDDVIPRGVAWSNGLKFEKSNYDLFYSQNSTFHKLTPSAIEMNELWWRSSLDFLKGSPRLLQYLDQLQGVVVRTRAVDEEDVRERVVLEKIVKAQEQKTVDMHRHLLSLEQIMNIQNTGPSDVNHLDKNGNRSENVHVGGLDHQSIEGNWNDVFENFPIDGLDHQAMKGVSQCMSVDHADMNLNDESESVAIDGLISLRSQDVHHISKVNNVLGDVHMDSVVKDGDKADVKTVVVPFQRKKKLKKACLSPYFVQQPTTEV
ncbi:hypothetical protein Tco_0647665 [Tanacetum coccineum]